MPFPKPVPVCLLLAILGCGLLACQPDVPAVTPGVSLELARHRAALLSDVRYRLVLSIPEDEAEPIDGKIAIFFKLLDDGEPLQLDFRAPNENLRQVVSNGREVDVHIENEHVILPAEALQTGANQVEISFIAGDSSLNRNPDYLYTLFVPDRARTAFPLFDQPDLKATFELTLTIPEGWTAMSNGPITSVADRPSGHQYEFGESERISSYLFSFVAGRFDTVIREIDGRTMTMLHRETDHDKVARNIDDIFALHGAALDWLERYTGIDYPYRKFGFVLLPAFQYGGMEHVGAIQYRAASLFLDEAPSTTMLLNRAALIAHETAHMWFGNLVTMAWFNDVWTKEVFANFMAAKIVNPSFPDVDHDLNFLVGHHPGAYSVDRTAGANPIRQHLSNLNEAGQMYGAIIYEKAPIMMRQLETLIGEDTFREGMREYLRQFAFGNATWPALIEILDAKTTHDLKSWSEVWVNTPGRPVIAVEPAPEVNPGAEVMLVQHDPLEQGRLWPQRFAVSLFSSGRDDSMRTDIRSFEPAVPLDAAAWRGAAAVVFNADGLGYGLFPADPGIATAWDRLTGVEKGATLINLYENMLAGNDHSPDDHLELLERVVSAEDNQLLLNLAIDQLQHVFWQLLPVEVRRQSAPRLEALLWDSMQRRTDKSARKMLFMAFADVAISASQVQKVHDVWSGERAVQDLPLSEDDRIDLAQVLAIKQPDEAQRIMTAQLANTTNPDDRRRLEFIAPSVSSGRATRDAFFFSLAEESNRATEAWVLEALRNLHHPLRIDQAERYLLPSLEWLQEIQVTGDIFFPKRWLDETLANHRSDQAVDIVQFFLDERPGYNEQLKMKILQSADMVFRANRILAAGQAH